MAHDTRLSSQNTPDLIGGDTQLAFPLKPNHLAGLLSLVLWLVSAFIVCVVAGVPFKEWELALWVAANAVPVVLWLVALRLATSRRRAGREAILAWITKAVIVSCHITCCGMIWLVLPVASPQAQFIIMVCLMAYTPTQVISSPENTVANRWGIVAVLGSATVFLATRQTVEAQLLAVYVGAYGLLMLVLSGVVGQAFRETFDARLASEATARLLERSLAAVAAERDAKTRFIATASHDLGQPLHSAALFFDQVMRIPDEAGRARAADGVRRSFAAAEQLLTHMLNHLRLEADVVEPQVSRIALGPLLLRMAGLHERAITVTGTPIRFRVAPTRLCLMLDPSLIDRALGNLVQNAIIHSGGARVLLAARRQGGRVRIWVIDDGMGVGRADARHIFDDYYQGQSKQHGVGFGLGLSSVRRIARLMGGEAGFDPRWLHGAAFYLDFPAHMTSPAARAHVAGVG